jgi:hypothetical protein
MHGNLSTQALLDRCVRSANNVISVKLLVAANSTIAFSTLRQYFFDELKIDLSAQSQPVLINIVSGRNVLERLCQRLSRLARVFVTPRFV